MAGRVLTAPQIVKGLRNPFIFLAGPIQGAADWQQDAIRYIRALDPHVHIANPRRPILQTEAEFTREMYAEQVDWETRHLNRAARNGCILFWLAKEAEHRCDRAYAQTTRFELAEWKAKSEWNDVRIALGIDQGFTGARYIRRRFAQDCPDIPIHPTLETACQYAVLCAWR